MNLFEATVRIDTTPMKTSVRARNAGEAKKLLESQYGKGNVLTTPIKV